MCLKDGGDSNMIAGSWWSKIGGQEGVTKGRVGQIHMGKRDPSETEAMKEEEGWCSHSTWKREC